MAVVIIKYNAGNIQSVSYALQRLGVEPVISDDYTTIQQADKVIFPGVGEASSAMGYLKNAGLDTIIKNLEQPVLGICLGMQLLCTHTEENDTTGLGIFNTEVKKFSGSLKVPQIGWNTVRPVNNHPLLLGLPQQSFCYFVHSYYAELCEATIAVTDYEIAFSSGLQYKNFYGFQFHPEKSAEAGSTILKNFLNL